MTREGDAAMARVSTWDGQRATKCDQIGCPNPPVIHAELTAPGTDYGAEADLCADHLDALAEQGRVFLVALGLAQPASELERNVAAAMGEHLADDTVLGYCPHGINLDRDFCPDGCRV